MRSQTIAQGLAKRARIVLGSAHGESIRELAERLNVSQPTVCMWRRRFREFGIAGLTSRARSGRRRRISHARERAVVSATMRPPQTATHWSVRRLAKEVGLSPATVHRIWQKYGLQPHRVEHFKFSTDPALDKKLADIVGLYLDPPERALVLCVDAQMTHDYKRHGTTSLFAALEVATGKLHGRCYRRHRHQEFLEFLNSLARRYPGRAMHLICGNYGTHDHPSVRQWLAAHPRFHLHFTPTSASWLNLVERWFGLISQQAIRRGSFDSMAQLERAITHFMEGWNQNPRPFVCQDRPADKALHPER